MTQQETKEKMTMTNQHNTKNIVDALSKFQEEGIKAVKDGTNPFFKSTYATLEDVIKVLFLLAVDGLHVFAA